MIIVKKSNGIYTVRFNTEHGQREVSTGSRNKEEAKKLAASAKIAEIEQAAKVAKLTASTVAQIMSGQKVKMREAVESWVKWAETVERSPRTLQNKRVYLSAWIRDANLSELYPSQITEHHVSKWINDPADKSKASTRRIKLSCVSTFMEFCMAKGWSSSNPAALVRTNIRMLSHTQRETAEKIPFTDDEVYRLMQNSEGFWNAAIAIGRWAGLRLGDICQLEWSSFSKPGKIIVWTDKRDTRVELPLVGELENPVARIKYVHNRYCFPDERAIATDPNRRSTLSTAFKRLCERSGIEGKSFHCLRYRYAQACLESGAPMPHIARQMGHRSVRTTEGYCGGRGAVEAAPAAL